MSLVAYAASSDSESDSESQSRQKSPVTKKPKLEIETSNGQALKNLGFTQLPLPKPSEGSIEEVQDEFLLKKETAVEKPQKKPIRITLPSLDNFDSDDEEEEKRAKKLVPKSSGLFAVLPPPKGTPLSNTTFVPNAVKRGPAPKKPVIKKRVKPKVTNPDDSEDEDVPKFDEKLWQKLCVPQKRQPKKKVEEVHVSGETADLPVDQVNLAPEPEKPYDGLDNEAFKELVGRSKRRPENIKLIDINEEEVLPEKDLWLTKSLTDPNMVPRQEPEEDEVNNTCKKKHHITYLAQQAKANEQELQNQWSQNKYNRKLTQSKYGF